MYRLIVLILLISTTPAYSNGYVNCVHEQLTSLGLFPDVEIDRVNPLTKNAINEIIERDSSFAGLPKLDKHTASFWCKRLGNKFELTSKWPSKKTNIDIVTGENFPIVKRRIVTRKIKEAVVFLNSHLSVDIPGTIAVTVSDDLNELANLTAKYLIGDEDRAAIYQHLKAQCKGREYTGASFGGVLALCFSRKTMNSDWSNMDDMLSRLTVHEISHEYQKQLVGNYRLAGLKRRDEMRGPKWLIEGTAIAIELAHAYPDYSFRKQIKWFRKQRRYNGNELQKLSSTTTKSNMKFQLYAGYAGVILATENGIDSFGEFWDATPELGWEAAFEKAFGLNVTQFYKEFGKFR